MLQSDKILDLTQGEMITVTGNGGTSVAFKVKMGDALLNGNRNQVWLEHVDAGNRLYLRRMPEEKMSIGPALFASLADLARTLDSGNYYFG